MPLLERPDTARISWESDGPDDGQAVLLIMGLAYPAAHVVSQVPALAEHHRVLRLDNRALAAPGTCRERRTPWRRWPRTAWRCWTLPRWATAHIVGISMGGLMAQEIAMTAPERVRSLCLLATHPGIAHAVMDPDALAMLGKRENLTPREAAEASIPFNYAPSTPR